MAAAGTFSLHLFRRLLRRFGLDLKRIVNDTPWLPIHSEMDPATFVYFVDLRHVPTVQIDVRDARLGIMAFPCAKAEGNPFVLAFEEFAAAQDDAAARSKVKEVLLSYYDSVQPASANMIVEVSPGEAPGLRDLPAHLWIAPWGTESVEQRALRTRMWTAMDGLSNHRVVSAKDGLTTFGPVSQRKLDLEVARVLKLGRSIRKHGYFVRPHDAPEVFALRNGGEYRWFVIRGQHRLAACAAYGIESVPARVTKIIRREDAGAWPHVVSGTYSVPGALRVFDRLYSGRPPSSAVAWNKLIATQRSQTDLCAS